MTASSFAAIAAASLTMLTATTGSAAVMTFKDLVQPLSLTVIQNYQEDGIIAYNNLGMLDITGGTILILENVKPHIFDTSSVTFKRDVASVIGGPFTPVSFDFAIEVGNSDFPAVKVEGRRDGVTTEIAQLSATDRKETFHFPTGLVLDSLTITNIGGKEDPPCVSLCSFWIDNVTLTEPTTVETVPTPKSLPLLAAAVGMIAYGARKRRKAA